MTIAVPLELTGLTKVFTTPSGPYVAVRDVNARINEGEFVCILGHSGCGKSTILSMIAGLQKSTFRHTFELLISRQQPMTPAQYSFQGVDTFRVGFNIYRKLR